MDSNNKSFLEKKLLFRSKNRGCKETCELIGRFAERLLKDMDENTLKDFSLILDENDLDIYNWLTQKNIPFRLRKNKALNKLVNDFSFSTSLS